MKALEKDRTRRYETANQFAADVERYPNFRSCANRFGKNPLFFANPAQKLALHFG